MNGIRRHKRGRTNSNGRTEIEAIHQTLMGWTSTSRSTSQKGCGQHEKHRRIDPVSIVGSMARLAPQPAIFIITDDELTLEGTPEGWQSSDPSLMLPEKSHCNSKGSID